MSLWRKIQRENFTNTEALLDFLEMEESLRAQVLYQSKFPINVPLRLARKMAKNSLEDPLVRQFLPLKCETQAQAGFCKDPVEEASFRKEKRFLQKYSGRALVLASSACAMHCRFCFRKHFDYAEGEPLFEREIAMIEKDTSLSEVILSGGDPLSLSDEKLSALLQKLAQIEHVKRLRIHTRFPIGIPERIDDSLLSIMAQFPKQIVFVLHCNHPLELDEDILGAMKSIQKLGILVLNQAVLLKGINDNLPLLKELMEKLADHGIMPYYLHQLDRVEGTSHFEVEEAKGRELVAGLAATLSGYAVPKYVREEAGETQKTNLIQN